LLLLEGALLMKLGKLAEAVRAYRLAASFAVEAEAPRFVLAERLLGEVKWEAAVDAWRAAAVIRRSRFLGPTGPARPVTPRASAFATLRAGLLMRIGRRRSALRALRAAVAARNPSPARCFRIGERLLGVQGWQAARAAYATLAVTRERARRAPARAPRGDVSMPAAPATARSARRLEAPRSTLGARLALTAASLCALVLAVGLVAALRGSLMAASALDGPEVRRLAERCMTLSGGPGLDACEQALAMHLSPMRASIVKEALAQKRARAARVPAHLGIAAGLDSKARP
jgi:tetratricopeptide (TPR) repeat protein